MRGWALLALLGCVAPLAGQDELGLTAGTRLLDRALGWDSPAVWVGGHLRMLRPSLLVDLSLSGAPATHHSWSGEAFGAARWERRIGGSAAVTIDGRGAVERRLHGGVDGEWRTGVGFMISRGGFSIGAGPAAYLGSFASAAGGTAAARLVVGPLRLTGELGRFAGLSGSRDGGTVLPVQDTLMAPVPPAGRPKLLNHMLVDGRFSRGILELSGRIIRRSPLADNSSGPAAGGNGWQLGAAVEPLAGVRVYLSAGRSPLGPSVYLPFARHLSLGVALVERMRRPPQRDSVHAPATRAAAFELEVLAEGQVVRVRHPTAQRVELVGDFSGWQPVPMTRRSEAWETRLRLTSGVYLINLRVDGRALEVPAGLSSTEDSFGGRAGVMIVP
ncbi:MAG: glycogen-binding domain-containing protein [Gemmatimonadales bacterium]